MASDPSRVGSSDNVDDGKSRSFVPPHGNSDLTYIHGAYRADTHPTLPQYGYPVTYPHYYPGAMPQTRCEGSARASNRVVLDRSTNVAPQMVNRENEIQSSHHLHDENEYEEPPNEHTPDPQTPPNPRRRPNVRRRPIESDDEEMNVIAMNENARNNTAVNDIAINYAATNHASIEQNHGHRQDAQGNLIGPNFFENHPHFASQVAERNGWMDPNQFQLSGRNSTARNANLLPSATFTQPVSEADQRRKRKHPGGDIQLDMQARRVLVNESHEFAGFGAGGYQYSHVPNSFEPQVPLQPWQWAFLDEQSLRHSQLPHVQNSFEQQVLPCTGFQQDFIYFSNTQPQNHGSSIFNNLPQGSGFQLNTLPNNYGSSLYNNSNQSFGYQHPQNTGLELAVDIPAEGHNQQEPYQEAVHTPAQSSEQQELHQLAEVGGKDSQNGRPQQKKSVKPCKRCRAKRVGCSRDLPYCERCGDKGVSCEYPQEPQIAMPQNRCTRCAKHGIHCNKALPACARCKKARVACEYEDEPSPVKKGIKALQQGQQVKPFELRAARSARIQKKNAAKSIDEDEPEKLSGPNRETMLELSRNFIGARPQQVPPFHSLENQSRQDEDEISQSQSSQVHLRGGGGLSSFENESHQYDDEDEHLEVPSSPVHLQGGGSHHNKDEPGYAYKDFPLFDDADDEELPHENDREIRQNGGLKSAAGINKQHSNMSNEELTQKGREYIKLRYHTKVASNLVLYKRLSELMNELGPDIVGWLEQKVQKKGIIDNEGLLRYEAEKRRLVEEEWREHEAIFMSRIDGTLPDLGYDPLSTHLTVAEKIAEVRRCRKAAVEIFGRAALRGEDRDMPGLDLELSSKEFNNLLDEMYGRQEYQHEHPAKSRKLNGAELTEISHVGPQTPRVSTTGPRVSMQTDSPTSPNSFQTAASDIEESEEGEICLVPTSPKYIAADPYAKIPSTARGPTTDAAGDADKGANEVMTIPTTPKKTAALPGPKSTKRIFDIVKARGISRDQTPVSRRSSPAPRSAEWSWGEAVGAGRSYSAIAPRVSTGPNVTAQGFPEHRHVVPSDQSSIKGGPIHSREPQMSGPPKKPLHSERSQQRESRGYRNNSATPTRGRAASISSATKANSKRGGDSTSNKHSVSQPPERFKLTRVDSSTRDPAPRKRINIFTTPGAQRNTSPRAPLAPAQPKISHQPTRSVENSTMSTLSSLSAQSTPSNEDFMASQQQPPIHQDSSPTPTGRGKGMSGASSSRRLTPPINSSPIKLSFTPKSQPSTNLREHGCADFFTPRGRTNAISKFNAKVAENPDKYKNLLIVADLKPDSSVLEISGPLGSNVRGSMKEIFTGYIVKARIPS